MVTLSITLPETLAETSQALARKIGLSRTELIRRALRREVEELKRRFEVERMAKGFSAMNKNRAYSALLEDIEGGFASPLSDEKEKWWK